MTSKQQRVVDFVAQNPGCTIMDIVRACWGGRGHTAEYDRVHRLRRNGVLRVEHKNGRCAVTLKKAAGV